MMRRNDIRRRGVVLLLILGLTAMFALSILTYMLVTSNMADTAQNLAKLDYVIAPSAQEDVGAALKNLLVGSNNERNPIGPFSILENMYGDWAEYDTNGSGKDDGTFDAYVALFPNLGFATVTPWLEYDSDGDGLNDAYDWNSVKSLFEQSGGVLTFVDGSDFGVDAWRNIVDNSSAFVLEKTITNPTAWTYASGSDGQYWRDHYYNSANALSSKFVSNQASYGYCDYWHFRVELTDELKRFIAEYGAGNVEGFNTSQFKIKARLNRPAFAGTGAGGFSPGETKDAQITATDASATSVVSFFDSYGMKPADLQIPYIFWGNAAAPDLEENTGSSYKGWLGYWNHLLGANYFADTVGWSNPNVPNAVRMNPSYTAPDERTPFLAHFKNAQIASDQAVERNVPSFHRPTLFQTIVDGGYLGLYSGAYSAAGKSASASEIWNTALLRKLTPRPLPLDHWNFDGGNLSLSYQNNSDSTALAGILAGGGDVDNDGDSQWDVDNDGDGIREGVWIPSGLPIRVDKNGTPYATMFSYTIVDLDGRVDVNAAGNWDQLPNNASSVSHLIDENGNTINEAAQPYDYVNELADMVPNSSAANTPFYHVESLNGSFGWRDDSDNETTVADRGDGLGPANVRLYEALSSIFAATKTTSGIDYQNEIATIASNLLWRRGLTSNEDPFGTVDQSGLKWFVDHKKDFTSQPGATDANYEELDDALGTQFQFFRYMNPTRVFGSDSEGDTDAFTTLEDVDVRFPWRGKTTVDMKSLLWYTPFDFANTAFRSYDPLGAQRYTYAPRYTDNPYLAYKNVSSWYDSPYSLPMLERLLRPSDADSGDLPSQLVDDLQMNGSANDPEVERERAAARLALTTISSDVPAPSAVFPDNLDVDSENYPIREGRFGFPDLIRKCVEAELLKAFDEKKIVIHDSSWDHFDAIVEEISSYLIAMLPPEILSGQKIDLNKLSQKDYWLDVNYDNGRLVPASDELHNVGLAKRMEYARGLYLVVMTLLYDDVNAKKFYENYDGLFDYSEAGFNLEKYKEGEEIEVGIDGEGNPIKERLDGERGLMRKELLATRVAQWCVNAVDFADPDATMTPFFFDPTPFDGWWVQDNDWINATYDDGAGGTLNRWETGVWVDDPEIHFLFSSSQGVPIETMEFFFTEALNNAKNGSAGASQYRDYKGNALSVKGSTTPKTNAQIIVDWLEQRIDKLEDQTSDLGFRLIWGMERPDLLLSETMSFHDLGIADTPRDSVNAEAEHGKVRDGTNSSDTTFDQVKRPEGSTYLELYCAANPNVPQSPELYDYDEETELWLLRLSKTTPIYIDAAGRKLNMPIWRVAISDSSDPRALNEAKEGATEAEKKEINNSKAAVYRKKWNGVLERLKEAKEFNFFSFQTQQYRNLPLPTTAPAIEDIGLLDLYQGWDDVNNTSKEVDASLIQPDWKDFNLRSSNVLGPAVAEKDGNFNAREIELDRIVWFSGEDDLDSLTAVSQYPDAFRTFANAVDTTNDPVYLEPNQYLVVGPEDKRAIGSLAFNSTADETKTEDMRFGQDPPETAEDSWIDGSKLAPVAGNYKYIVAKSLIGNRSGNEDLRRGLNISEPLWTDFAKDPYYNDPSKMINPNLSPTDANNGSRDIPFETPLDWVSSGVGEPVAFQTTNIANYPIVQDKLFGVGTVPAYKSAFVQRVADPNRAYHPLLNPYISVDWNVMDLTVFTGDCIEAVPGGLEDQNRRPFADNSDFKDSENQIKIAKKRALTEDSDEFAYNSETAGAFSSRQWGGAGSIEATLAFAPTREFKEDEDTHTKKCADKLLDVRPNPWARAVDFEKAGATAGLDVPQKLADVVSTKLNYPAMRYIPRHTLGFYNNRGVRGVWTTNSDGNPVFSKDATSGTTYENLYDNKTGNGVYDGASVVPFEHLVWNDAPYSNPFELALVPASAPGRFGLEFVRPKESKEFSLKELYDVESGKDKGTSLGSNGIFGFSWFEKDDDNKEKGKIGPNLNFFASSKKPGETLNLCRVLDFVYTPSLFLGTKQLAGRDENGGVISDFVRERDRDDYRLSSGNPTFHSARREPGKVNINTLTEPVWKAISPSSTRYYYENRLSGTPWSSDEDPTIDDSPLSFTSGRNWDSQPSYFHSPQTARLFATLNRQESPLPTSTTLLTGADGLDESSKKDPLFDAVGVGVRVQKLNDSDEKMFERIDGQGGEVTETEMTDAIVNSEGTEHPLSRSDYRAVMTDGLRNNLYEATSEMQRLSGVTTTRSNVFAVWVTVGYFEVERCKPGVNMPNVDPEGNAIVQGNANRLLDSSYKWYQYYQAIYPDGYTYGQELGAEFGETKRRRGFAIIDRSIPVDYRRGSSVNYQNAVLLFRILD